MKKKMVLALFEARGSGRGRVSLARRGGDSAEEEETVQEEEETVQVEGEETVQEEEETVQVEGEETAQVEEEETAQVEEEETVQRPVAASRNKSLKSHNCSAAASFDANAVSTLKVLGRHAYTARAPRPFLSSGASWSGRSYCVKSKDALASDEPGKKDDVPSGPTGDECGFKLICFVGINVCLRGGLHAMWLFGLEFICDRQLIPGRRVAMRILRYVLRLVRQLC
ncbi:unnamed protein product [Arctogadus glacialis]